MAAAPPTPMTLTQYQEVTYLCVKLSGRPPSFAQWAAVAADLLCEPPGARYVQEYSGRSMVVTADPCTLYAPYNGLFGKPLPNHPFNATYDSVAGLGWPVPICNVTYAYPETPNGIATGGVSPPLHEKGHSLSRLLGTEADPLHARKPWVAALAAVLSATGKPWWDGAPNDDERFADAYAAWCLWRAGKVNRLNPLFLSDGFKAVRDYFDDLARTRLLWRPGVS